MYNEFLVIYIGSFDTPSTLPLNYLHTERRTKKLLAEKKNL